MLTSCNVYLIFLQVQLGEISSSLHLTRGSKIHSNPELQEILIVKTQISF